MVFNKVAKSSNDKGTKQMAEEDKKGKEELLKLVDQMAALDKKSSEVGRQLGEVLGEMRLIRARFLLEVAREENERGKLVYPNEKLREAAVTVRLAEDNEYQVLREQEKTLRHQHDDLLNELRRLAGRKELLTTEQDRGLFSLLLGLGKR
jgi:hypothetical protein